MPSNPVQMRLPSFSFIVKITKISTKWLECKTGDFDGECRHTGRVWWIATHLEHSIVLMMRLPLNFGGDLDGTLNPGSCHQAHLVGHHMLEWLNCDYALVSSSANQQKARSNPPNCWAHTSALLLYCDSLRSLPFTPVPDRRLASFPFHTHQGIIWLYNAETSFQERHGIVRWIHRGMYGWSVIATDSCRQDCHGFTEAWNSRRKTKNAEYNRFWFLANKSVVLAPMNFRLKCRAGLSKSTLR